MEPPLEWWIGRLCSEFPALHPRTAWDEWRRAPVGVFETIVEYRAYAEAKQMTDGADTADARKRLPRTPLFRLVTEIEAALVQAELARERAARDEDGLSG